MSSMLDEETENPNFEYGYIILPEEAENHPMQLLTPGMELVCSRGYLLTGDAPTVLDLQGAGSADEAGIRWTINLTKAEYSKKAVKGHKSVFNHSLFRFHAQVQTNKLEEKTNLPLEELANRSCA